ncbi:hypothetical protein KUTeg_010450 [Tegillarca granosa]|uniref:CARD domain-containing protein n=1 Tax=Tegillarca granosa TaxID=220873 RepID=A0ABQ9FB47_TEGGR|nr:hypothetical protein KUTeg_010450 [Tegillarca granosa]
MDQFRNTGLVGSRHISLASKRRDQERIIYEPTSTGKVAKLLRILESKPSYDAFLHALEVDGYPFIKEELQKRERELLDERRQLDVQPEERRYIRHQTDPMLSILEVTPSK